MARLNRDGSDAVINFSTIEKIEGLLGSTRFPLAHVSSVEVLEDAYKQVEGWGLDFKLAGRYVPDTTAVGTFRNGDGGGTTLALVHPDTPRGLRLYWVGEPYRCVVIGLPDPEATKAAVFGE